jgi:hypothetical protein
VATLPVQDLAARDSSPAAHDSGGGSVGRFRALVDTIIGNLELKISNIHILYEDSSSNPGHNFCIGLLLSEISAHTVGEDWQRKFVTADALLTLRKVGDVREKLTAGLGLCLLPLVGQWGAEKRCHMVYA